MTSNGSTLGQRVAELRRRRGLSQRELGVELGRSESWISQVERDVQPVERIGILTKLAEALGVTTRDLRPEVADSQPEQEAPPPPNDLDSLRLALTGHPSLPVLFAQGREPEPVSLDNMEQAASRAWDLTHASRFADLSKHLTEALPALEAASRQAPPDQQEALQRLRARIYQAVSAAFARQDEPDASWVAADRAIHAAELAGNPLEVVAGHFRMAHAFIRLQRLDQAERVATAALGALTPLVTQPDAGAPTLSLYGAMHLVSAVIRAKEAERALSREHIAVARQIAKRLGDDRNDFQTEFGPTNVQLHAVSTAVDLGDAGEALDLAKHVNASRLSPERQSRFLLDVARAHAQRRQVGEAVAALLEAETLAPEQIHGHYTARQTIRDLVRISGRRRPAELQALASRAAVEA